MNLPLKRNKSSGNYEFEKRVTRFSTDFLKKNMANKPIKESLKISFGLRS
jgi:hypothetical protein